MQLFFNRMIRIFLFLAFGLLLLTGFKCEPYSYTEKIHVYFNQDNTIRVLATLETNGYQAEWSDLAKSYISSYQAYQDSLMRRNYAGSVRKMEGQWDEKIRIYAVEGVFRDDYDFMRYMAPDNALWDCYIGRNDSIWRMTFNLTEYRRQIALYGWAYQIAAKEIIRSGKIKFTLAGIDSFYQKKVRPVIRKESPELQEIVRKVTFGILSESEKVIIPFNQTLFSLQKYRFHVGGMAYDLSSEFLKQDVDGSLVYFPYPETSRNMLSYAVYSPFRPTYSLHQLQEAVETEVPTFISFKWKRLTPKAGEGNADRVYIIPVKESGQ
ncbi:MAG: hypothetical protein L6Q77_07390 [Bacteroidetes bacterium]|nr:hypothetical protein [Bacteroidota bacterium]